MPLPRRQVTCGCDRPHYAFGLCRMHYERRRRATSSSERLSKRKTKNLSGCSVIGCPREYYARGLCQKHYSVGRRRLRPAPRRPYHRNPLVPQIEELARTMKQSHIAKLLAISRMIVIGVVDRARKMGRLPDQKAKVYAPPREFPPPGSCLWMDGDPRDPGSHFCGSPVFIFGEAWCANHRRRVYLPPRDISTPFPEQTHALEAVAAAD